MSVLGNIFSDIKIQHTLFALPFAVMSAFMAADGWPGWRPLGLIIVAMFFVRSAAMAFNRLTDQRFDKDNPRTKNRPLAAGRAKQIEYVIFVVATSAGFVITCSFINDLAFKLSPVALLMVFFYSITKRFTSYSHFFLGAALALAPVGAWVAMREEIAMVPLILGAAVLFWLAGLDIIYSCQDYEFDRQNALHSIPERFGPAVALKLSALFHLLMVTLLIVTCMVAGLSWISLIGVGFTAALLVYEHSLVRPDDLSRANVAFFNVNGLISVGLTLFVIADTLFAGKG